MSESVLVAVPSNAPGGLQASPSAHFGHCDLYTVALVQDGNLLDIAVEPNRGHEHGGCIVPVRELVSIGVKVLIAGGMGMNPLMAMKEMGLKVLYASGYATVEDVFKAYIDGKLPEFGSVDLCRGGCGHHH